MRSYGEDTDMDKQEFLNRLKGCLAQLDRDEMEAALGFYDEQISDRMDAGMPEHEAVASLEAPEDIAANLMTLRNEGTPRPILTKERKGTTTKVLIALVILLTSFVWIPLVISIVGIVVGAYLAVWATVLAGVAVVLAGGIGSLLMLVASIAVIPQSPAVAVSQFGIFLGMAGSTILAAILTILVAKGLVMFTKWAIDSIAGLFTRRSRIVKEG